MAVSEPDGLVLELLAPLVAAAVEDGHDLAVLSGDPSCSEPVVHPMTEMQDPGVVAPGFDALSAAAWDADVVIAAEGDFAGADAADALHVPWLEVARTPPASQSPRSGRPPTARIVQDPTSPGFEVGSGAVVQIPMRPRLPHGRSGLATPFLPSDFRVRVLVLGDEAGTTEGNRGLLDGLDLRELQVVVKGVLEVAESDVLQQAAPEFRVTELLGMVDIVVTAPRFAVVVDALVQGVPLVLLPGTASEDAFAARLEDVGAALHVTEVEGVGAAVRAMIRRPQFFANAAALGRDILVRADADQALLDGLVEAVLTPADQCDAVQ
jgi:hypothetical protein